MGALQSRRGQQREAMFRCDLKTDIFYVQVEATVDAQSLTVKELILK